MRISNIRVSARPELHILGSKQVKYATSEQVISQNMGRSNKNLTDWPQEKKKINHLNLKPTDQDDSNHVTQRLASIQAHRGHCLPFSMFLLPELQKTQS